MIAKVYPIRRLPAHTGPFDYICAEDAHIGDLVEIPFKGRNMLGVIWELHETSEYKRLATVNHVVQTRFLREGDVQRLNALALINAQSVSAFLNLFPLTSKKKSPRKHSAAPAKLTYTKDDAAEAIARKDERIIIDSVRTWPLHILHRIAGKGQHILICPNDDVAHFLHRELSRKHKCALATGDLTHYEERALFDSWKDGSTNILIANRHATIWPAHALKSVTIVDAGHPDYAFRPRNPRFDARFAAYMLARQFEAPLYQIGHTSTFDIPPIDSLDPITHTSNTTRPTQKPHIIDLAKHPSKSPYFPHPVFTQIEEYLSEGKRILLHLNKKGVATHFQCRSCGHLPTCGTCGALPMIRKDDLICPSCSTEMWYPTVCPSCHKKTLSKKGIGIEHVQSTLETVIPKKKHIVHKDGAPIPSTFDTLLISESGMRKYEITQMPAVHLIIDLCADYHFLDETYACDERGQYKLMRSLHLAKDQRAECYIQSYQGKRLDLILAPDWPQKEANLRKKHDLPPYGIELNLVKKDMPTELLRVIDKNELLRYLHDFRSLSGRDTIEVNPQIAAYERITPSK